MTLIKHLSYLLIPVLFMGLPGVAQTDINAEELFDQRCTSCHTINEGKLVGPELKGVTERRNEEWLIKFIRNSQKMIKSGDQTAEKLFNEHNQTLMPSNPDLSDKQIKALLAYIQKGGSENDKQEGDDTLIYPANRGEKASGSPLASVSPNDFIFQATFWFSAVLIVGMVLGFGYIISRIS